MVKARALLGATMTVETPSSFAFELENGDRYFVELDGGAWYLKSERDQRGLAPNLGHVKIGEMEAIKRAWQRLDELYFNREAAQSAE